MPVPAYMTISCPNCLHRRAQVMGEVMADPSIGRHDEGALLACENCGYKFSTNPNLWVANEQDVRSIFRGDPAQDAKAELMRLASEVSGRTIPNLGQILRVLSHPDVIEETKRYFNAMDKASMCTKYEAPWSCAKEAEAMYENIQFGWLGGGSNGIGLAAWWCDNCRKRVSE